MSDVKTLKVTAANGTEIEINVIDIVKSEEFNKEYVIFSLNEDNDNVYSSILVEDENSFDLQAITNQDEIEFVAEVIKKIEENMNNNV